MHEHFVVSYLTLCNVNLKNGDNFDPKINENERRYTEHDINFLIKDRDEYRYLSQQDKACI